MAAPNLTESGYQSMATTWWANQLSPIDIPELMWPQSIEVYDKMRRTDDQVLSVLKAVTYPIRSTPWRIDGTGCKASVTKLIADDLGLPIVGKAATAPRRSGRRFDFDEHLRLALLKLPFGHSFFEQVYAYNERGDGFYHLKKLAWRPNRTITAVEVDAFGGLLAITQYGVPGQTETRIPVENLVAYVNDREGGNWLGQSLLRPAYKFWLLKEMGLRVQAQTNERNGMGLNIYTSTELPENPSEEDLQREKADREAGLAMARALRAGTTTGAAIPGGSKMETQGVQGRLPDPEAALTRYDDGIARSVLAHFLTLGGNDATGSYALGDTFAEFFTGSLKAVAKEIASTIQQHVIEDLVDANWGPDEPAPQIVFDDIGSKASIDAAGIMSLAQSGMLTLDYPLEEWVRNRYGMPGIDPSTSRPNPTQQTGKTDPVPDDGGDNGNTDNTDPNADPGEGTP